MVFFFAKTTNHETTIERQNASAEGALVRRSPANDGNFVHEQNEYGCQRSYAGQRVATEEVQGHGGPAETGSDESADYVGRSDRGREIRALDVPQPEELPECPYHDEKLRSDSDLSPAFSSHGGLL